MRKKVVCIPALGSTNEVNSAVRCGLSAWRRATAAASACDAATAASTAAPSGDAAAPATPVADNYSGGSTAASGIPLTATNSGEKGEWNAHKTQYWCTVVDSNLQLGPVKITISQWSWQGPSPSGTVHILMGKFAYSIIRFIVSDKVIGLFPISEFSYKLIRLLL